MGIGVSVFMIAVGAILTWAISATVQGIDLNVVGVILMVVGALGLAFSLMFLASFAPFARDREVVRDRETRTDHRHAA